MNYRESREHACILYANRLKNKCHALLELPRMIYVESMFDDLARIKPYKLSFDYCRKTVLFMIQKDMI